MDGRRVGPRYEFPSTILGRTACGPEDVRATIGPGVIIRPRTRVKYPWNLAVGRDSWIGEGVWIHNQADVRIGSDTVISQETLVTTGSHAYRGNMDLVVEPVAIGSGVWIASRSIIAQGVVVGDDAVVGAGSVVTRSLPGGCVYAGIRQHL